MSGFVLMLFLVHTTTEEAQTGLLKKRRMNGLTEEAQNGLREVAQDEGLHY